MQNKNRMSKAPSKPMDNEWITLGRFVSHMASKKLSFVTKKHIDVKVYIYKKVRTNQNMCKINSILVLPKKCRSTAYKLSKGKADFCQNLDIHQMSVFRK